MQKCRSLNTILLLGFVLFLVGCQIDDPTEVLSPTPTLTASPSSTVTPTITSTSTPTITLTSTATSFPAVLRGTQLPAVQAQISAETASELVQIAKWEFGVEIGNDIAFSPDGSFLAVGAGAGGARLMDISNGNTIGVLAKQGSLPENQRQPTKLAISPNGEYAITGTSRIAVWDLPSREFLREERYTLSTPQFSPDSQFFAITHPAIGDFILYNIFTLGAVHVYAHSSQIGRGIMPEPGDEDVMDIAFSPRGDILASGASDGYIYFWSVEQWIPVLREMETGYTNFAHWTPYLTFNVQQPVSLVTFSPDGRFFAAVVDDTTINVWDLRTLEIVATMGHAQPVNDLTFSTNGQVLATASKDTIIRLWDSQNGELLKALEEHTGEAYRLAFSPNGRLLASQGTEGTVRIWGILPASDSQSATATSEAAQIMALTPTITPLGFPTQTPTPSSEIPPYDTFLPWEWPLTPITREQIVEVQNCEIEILAEQRYPEELSISELERAYWPTSGCDWAVLASAYLERLIDSDPIPEEGKRAFSQTISLNPAYMFAVPLFYGYYGSVPIVEVPPMAMQGIKNLHIEYSWGGIGDSVNYELEITHADSVPSIRIISIFPESLRDGLSQTIDKNLIQALSPALTDFIPIDSQFSLAVCTDHNPDWNVTILFNDGASLELSTNESNFMFAGGPWQTEINQQNYFQFSPALTQGMVELVKEIGLPLGQPHAMFCAPENIIQLAFP